MTMYPPRPHMGPITDPMGSFSDGDSYDSDDSMSDSYSGGSATGPAV